MFINLGKKEFEFEVSSAFKFLCFFLAQNDEPLPPHEQLGFATQADAFSSIADLFGSKKRTVQNERDAFDAFTDSERTGWQKPLPPRLKPIFDEFGELTRDDMFQLAKTILETDWNLDNMPVLPDLEAVIDDCKQKISQLDPTVEFQISKQEIEEIVEAYGDLETSNKIKCSGGHSFWIESGKGNSTFISFQEIPILAILAEHLSALEVFRKYLDEIALEMGYSSRKNGEVFFKNLPLANWKSLAEPSDVVKFEAAVMNVFPNSEDQLNIIKFVTDKDWGGGIGKKLDRPNDWQDSAIKKTGGFLSEATANRVSLIRAIEAAGLNSQMIVAQNATSSIPVGENIIFYGAPGTGKTHRIEQVVKYELYHRTVFHPDTQNSDFVGSLKPVMEGKDVTYKFAPGPFSRAMADAYDNPSKKVFLVIEELNRAPAAAVFGELFLLLDRKDDGAGEYDADFPSREMAVWFTDEKKINISRMSIPSNLSIYATMNSADQGVYPLDTAFRRRWRQEYVAIDYNGTNVPQGTVDVVQNGAQSEKIIWPEFAEKLNRYLVEEHSVQEDRLVGPYFVKENELKGSIPGKVLIYLWDDLLRHGDRSSIFDLKKASTYGDISKSAQDGKQIFSNRLIGFLVEAANGSTESE